MSSKAADIALYAQAAERFAGITAVASLVPLILACRFHVQIGSRRQRAGKPARGKAEGGEAEREGGAAAAEGGGDVKEGGSAEAAPPPPAFGAIGLSSLLLLTLSVLCGHAGFFQVKKAGAKGLGGPLGALLEGVRKGRKAISPLKGAGENLAAAVAAALAADDAFNAAQGGALLLACGIVFVSGFFYSAPTLLSSRASGGRLLPVIGKLAALALLFGAFLWGQEAAVGKAWKAVASEQIVPTLQLPLRVAALVLAARPAHTDADRPGSRPYGTPAMFACLQTVSVMASLAAALARGELAKVAAKLLQRPPQEALLEPSLYVAVVPTGIAVAWLAAVHLQRSFGAMMLASALMVASSPVALARWWPEVCKAVGASTARGGTAALLEATSLGFAGTVAMLIIAGGTPSIMVAMLLLQALARVHGAEPLMAAFS